MSVTILSQAPTARCYHCGAPAVQMVCHHCGRLMCETDGRKIVSTSTGASSREFDRLGLDETLGRGTAKDRDRWEVHCGKCAHKTPSYGWMKWLGGLLAGLSIIIGLGGGEAGAVAFLLLVGLGLIGGGFLLQQRQPALANASEETGVPLVPRINSLMVRDIVTGHIRLDAKGEYTSQVQGCTGSLTMRMVLTPKDRERCKLYRTSRRLLAEDDMLFHAGFVVLDGAASLRFLDRGTCLPDRTNVIALTGNVSQHPYLVSTEGRKDNLWDERWDYELLTGDQIKGGELPFLPLRLAPSLVQGADRKALELELQFVRGETNLEGAKLESLELLVPNRLGQVKDVRPNALLTPTALEAEAKETYQGLTWRQLSLTKSELQAGRKIFYVRFTNEIEPDTQLKGKMRAVFRGNLTSLERVIVFYPWGRRRPDVAAQQEVVAKVAFELNLAALRYQDSLTLYETLTYDDVIPDYALVTALTDALSEEELYVKWVIENPSRTSPRGAHIVNRYWDIAGRMYDGIFPVNWHLVVTGEEARWPEMGESPGRTRFDLTLHGSFASDEMRQLVHNVQDRMKMILTRTVTG